jgi:hypothetical protein
VDAHQIPVIERNPEVVIIGAGTAGVCVVAKLRDAGISDVVMLDREVISSVFDDDTDTWRLTTRDGATYRGQVVIATYASMHVPWLPDLPGRNDFRGSSFHATTPDPDFDAAGKRVAIIGSDAAAGQLISRLTTSAASIEVFPLPPRRFIPRAPHFATRITRWLRHEARAELVNSPIDAVTASGIRTRDGAHHATDAIVYGTGFAIRAGLPDNTLVGTGGLTIQHAWRDGMEPYLGVALHGFPNYFMLSASEFDASVRYVVTCLQLKNGHTRIGVRHSTEQVFNERVYLHRPSHRLEASAFDLSSSARVHDDTYHGTATLTLADTCRQVQVRLSGHVNPIDGQYHWQGTIFDHLPADLLTGTRSVQLAAGGCSAPARITEATPQGTHSIAGVGAPPFTLAGVELTVPQR